MFSVKLFLENFVTNTVPVRYMFHFLNQCTVPSRFFKTQHELFQGNSFTCHLFFGGRGGDLAMVFRYRRYRHPLPIPVF